MPAAIEPLLMTVEEYRQLPGLANGFQELRCGRVVTMTFPKKRHTRIQSRLVELLSPQAKAVGFVAAELPFRALPEYDLRAADVAFVSRGRWEATDDDDNLRGAPELVIEVLSPSNTMAEIREKAALCLANGAEEFWVVDSKRQTVTATRRTGDSVVYQAGDFISLPWSEEKLEVGAIFA